MEIDINLDFLHYQEKQILDGSDYKMKELNSSINIFDDFMATKPIEKIIQIIIIGYKEKYAQEKYFATCFYDLNSSLERPKKPNYLGESDFFVPKEEMIRKDIEHLILRIFEDDYTKTNTDYLKELELVFTDSQDFKSSIEEALEGKMFSQSESSESIIFTVEDSPISEIEINSKKFVMRINPDKWKAYY